MKKNWTKIALALGPAIMVASYVWEYAKTTADYTYLVQPWAIRGSDTIHGEIFAVVGILLFIGGILTASERSMTTIGSALIVGYVILASTGVALRYATDEITFTLAPPMNVAASVILAAAISLTLRGGLGEKSKWFKRALPIFIPLFLALFFFFAATLVGNPVSIEVWLLILIDLSIIGILSIAAKPAAMGGIRTIILAGILAGGVVTFSAGALRQSLIEVQLATPQANGLEGVAAAYKDTQAAGGWWLAGFGALVFFFGAVGLWAKRRDVVAALDRAKRQRAAAEQSAKEIQDAADAYAREHEGSAASTP